MTANGIPPVVELSSRFQGELVVVEPLSLEHESALVSAAREGDLFRWFPVDMSRSSEDMHRWLIEAIEAARSGREVPFAIVSRATGQAVGSTRFLEVRLEHLRVEIGWTWVARAAWGSGINVETKLLLLGHAFERVGCRRVEFKTDARNERSRGALEALGAKFEGIHRKHMVVSDGAPRDSAYYSVIDEEWPELKTKLQRRLAQVGV